MSRTGGRTMWCGATPSSIIDQGLYSIQKIEFNTVNPCSDLFRSIPFRFVLTPQSCSISPSRSGGCTWREPRQVSSRPPVAEFRNGVLFRPPSGNSSTNPIIKAKWTRIFRFFDCRHNEIRQNKNSHHQRTQSFLDTTLRGVSRSSNIRTYPLSTKSPLKQRKKPLSTCIGA